MFRYPWGLLPRIGSRIELSQKDAAHRDLDEVLAIIWEQSDRNLPVCRLRCAAVSSYCSRGALQAGASSVKVLEIQLHFLDDMAAVRSWTRASHLMHRYVDALLSRVRPVQATSLEQTVARIREIMRESMASAPSLAQHAAAFGVSAGHLSRCFATIAGCTFQQETRRLRMDRAVQLLIGTNLKVAAIAEEVGIPDTSRFILEFRKELGVTPGAYRRTHCRTAPLKGSSRD
jgi:AraC-like DNA-binding protein